MNVVGSYGVYLSSQSYRIAMPTIKYFHSVVSFLIDVCLEHYDEWKDLPTNSAQMYIDGLIHKSGNHKPLYPSFNKRFYKFPCMYRRSAIDSAKALVLSYRKCLDRWKELGCVGKRPRLNRHQNVMPCLFRRDLYKLINDNTCSIKLFVRNDWVWVDFRLRKSDVAYLKRNFKDLKASAPVLEKRMHKLLIRFTYEQKAVLPEFKTNSNAHPLLPNKICAVDLGVNKDATCSIMSSSGTVTARKFIDSPVEKDRMYRLLDRIKTSQRVGNKHHNRLWRFVDHYNTAVSVRTASEIVHFAKANNAKIIVLEHLDMSGKCKGSKKQKLALWRKKEILHRATALAHRFGIRVSTVNAWNTSKLTFDGSGAVTRNVDGNYSICRFATGKIYNCDLSASYNIGARYYLRLMLDQLPEKVVEAARAKTPELSVRTRCTLSTLITLHAVLKDSSFDTESSGLSVEGKSAPSKEGRSVA